MRVEEISDLIKKAEESLDAANHLLKAGHPDFASSRSYYAMFYTAEAILLTKDLSFSKHKAVISAFGKEFVKTGLISSTLHRSISDAFDIRQTGDYGPIGSVSEEKAATLIKQTEEFIDTVKKYLRIKGYEL
ncbi:MAG: HEPN domain-containing protein [Deltaproteobacteria bacterium]|nr:HEPN domain-containing protein [Deltaproteobacteria bacterium]MCL5792229.1 HEPN domain-containing protein [Deltaproteobacteria bacterium]